MSSSIIEGFSPVLMYESALFPGSIHTINIRYKKIVKSLSFFDDNVQIYFLFFIQSGLILSGTLHNDFLKS